MSRASATLVRVRGLLSEERALAVLLPQARRLAELNRLFTRAVPKGVVQSCRVVAQDGETAVIYCSHGAAAARLRSQAATVAGALSASGAEVAGLRAKVRADWQTAERGEKAAMNAPALDAWRALEGSLPEGGLKAAVTRLLKHHGRLG
jgi:Dna[CI] antecedent, DciA